MKAFEEQLLDLKRFYPDVRVFPEGGTNFIFFPNMKLPSGCQPEKVDALLCPVLRDGYNTRLFYAQLIEGIPQKNWNGNLRICDKNWVSYSWKSKDGMELLEMVRYHLSTLTLTS
jgi:hypothetical protein